MKEASAVEDGSLESLVGQVADEFLRRQQRGENPTIEEYEARYPQAAPLLRAVLASLRLIDLSATPATTETAPAVLGDFRLRREIGRGGMGIVYEAEQISLRRRVALKVLPLAATLDERRLQRFKNEAQAAAQLQHAHIVPVYAVGCERGIHYFAMQFIEGRTLADLIAEQRSGAAGTVGSESATTVCENAAGPSDPAYFRRAAELGLQAADALEYAHQAGIIHRDVKPGNLLLDERGQLWVSDFGLAHCQCDVSLTLTGDLIGTLRYLSPEQARGGREPVDPRADTYSLGATLYELLTLRPAVDGKDREEILRKIAEQEPIPPRQHNRAIPRELEIIVQTATAHEPEERYASAQELADDLQRFLADQPILAQPPSRIQRLRKWAKRHRALVTLAGVFLVCGVLLAAGLTARLERRRAATVRAATVHLHRAELLQEEGRWTEARAALTRAEERLSEEGPEPLRQRVHRLQDDLDWVLDLEAARLQAVEALVGHNVDFAAVDHAYRQAFAKRQFEVEAENAEESARRIQSLAIREPLVQALDHWSFVKEQLRAGSGAALLDVARRSDADAWRQQLRQTRLWKDREGLQRLAGDPTALTQPAIYLVILALYLDLQDASTSAERLLRRAQANRPDDFWINFMLANLLSSVQVQTPLRLEEAVSFYRAALAQRPRSAPVYLNLGVVLALLNRSLAAEQAFRKVLELRGPYAPAYANLGGILARQQRLDEAEQVCRQAIAVDPAYAEAHNNLGNVLMQQDKLAEAESELHRSLALNANNALAHYSLGILRARQGKLPQAEKAFRAALAVWPNHAETHANLGLVCHQLKKLDEAEKEERRAIGLRPNYAEAWFHLANVLTDRGKKAEAEEALRQAIACKPDFEAARHNLRLLVQQRGGK